MRFQRSSRRQGADCGQALPLGLVFCVAVIASMLFLFSTSKLVDEKLTVTNAADTAAYSTGVVQARALNYEAYLNRAIVANELAIGQAISLISWVEYFANAVINDLVLIEELGRWAYYLDFANYLKLIQFSGTLTGTAIVNAYFGGSITTYIQTYAPYVGILVDAFDATLLALRASLVATDVGLATLVTQKQVARAVAQKSDPTLQAEIVLTAIYQNWNFTHTYGKNTNGDERGRLSSVVTRSRDAFTANRSWTIDGVDIPFVQENVAIKRRGGTDLVSYDEWVAVDTLASHGTTFGCGKIGLSWCSDQETPIAYASVDLSSNGSSGTAGPSGGAKAENPQTTQLALDNQVDLTQYYAYWPGLGITIDLADLTNKDPRLPVTVFVYKPMNTSKTAGRNPNIHPTGQLDLFNAADAAGSKIASISTAEVYFSRPEPRPDGLKELPSLYSPYWQSHLIATSETNKLLAAALYQSGKFLPPVP